MVPKAYTPVRTVRPNAKATPRNPMPSETPSDVANLAAKTALPQPPRTNQKVPMNSAVNRCSMVGGVIAQSRTSMHGDEHSIAESFSDRNLLLRNADCATDHVARWIPHRASAREGCR